MSGPAKAALQQLNGEATPQPVGDPLRVQFNPTSLRLQMTNANDGGRNRARQRQQHLGQSSTTLTCDLVFDSADEGETGAPVNVRDKTAIVRRFLLPAEGSREPPPRVRFQWGDFIFDGIVDSCTEEIDLFSESGVPLRAKCSISIKEQDPRFAANETGPGSGDASSATPPGGGSGAPGTAGGGGDRTGVALSGESAADFAARMGLDPGAWRGLSVGLDSTLSLQGGLEIDFSAGLSVSAGIGLSAGLEAGASASLEQAFGLVGGAAAAGAAGGAAAGGATSGRAAGFALAAAGGLAAAVETVKIAEAETAASHERAVFRQPGAPAAPQASARPARPTQPRPPLRTGGLPSPAAQARAAPAPPPPQADPRTTSFGFGVPLRPRAGGAVDQRAGVVAGRAPLRLRPPTGVLPPTSRHPTVPPWVALPERDPARAAADADQAERRPAAPCGCAGRCGCGGS